MNHGSLEATAKSLVAEGKGILAADETVGTITKRFESLNIRSTEESRRTYREMLFTTPDVSEFISGVIMYDETIRQKDTQGTPLPDVCSRLGIIPGIKVDTGAKDLAGSPGEKVTEGLDRLRDRLSEYYKMGARFSKWRAVIQMTDSLPTQTCLSVNSHALGRYAALCQEQGLVPIVEPEVLMDGPHTIGRCQEITGQVLQMVFNALYDQRIFLEGILLKPNMVISGKECSKQASVQEVAQATLQCLRRHVPAAVPGIVFLSGGQDDRLATEHLNAINSLPLPKPWKISFSYGRALQDAALEGWHGKNENLRDGQQAFYHRARCNGAATMGKYTEGMEEDRARKAIPAHRAEWHDD
ncbi:MAG: fructose-bisphosphate aldolase class I [Nitrospira sp.]|nr:fructose-bisphosphate aldolase class I [Nitrospira sp.]